MPEKLQHIIDVTDTYLPKHGRGVIAPEAMLEQHDASCFGRLALVGSAWLQDGLAEDSLHLLISHNHGVALGDGKYWLGHAALAIDDEALLIDADRQTHVRDLHATTSWLAGHDSTDTVTDYFKVPRPSAKPVNQSALEALVGLVGPEQVNRLHHHFSAHPFAEGIQAYQATHPAFANAPTFDAESYAACYQTMASQLLAA